MTAVAFPFFRFFLCGRSRISGVDCYTEINMKYGLVESLGLGVSDYLLVELSR